MDSKLFVTKIINSFVRRKKKLKIDIFSFKLTFDRNFFREKMKEKNTTEISKIFNDVRGIKSIYSSFIFSIRVHFTSSKIS